jgi:hypothetical protein
VIEAAINKILGLAAIEKLEFNGRPYTSKGIVPVYDPTPKVLTIDTLTGLSDYLKADIDMLKVGTLILHVKSHQVVDLLSSLGKTWADRNHYIAAACDSLKFPFGQFMDVENFIIRIQSMFVQDETTATILKIVGNITDGMVTGFSDDGVSQKVTAKSGVSRVAEIPVPNPIILRPYRTFLEIDQPASPFVFRMRSGEHAPPCALFEADGGVWKNEAMKNIKEWLQANTNDIPVIA